MGEAEDVVAVDDAALGTTHAPDDTVENAVWPRSKTASVGKSPFRKLELGARRELAVPSRSVPARALDRPFAKQKSPRREARGLPGIRCPVGRPELDQRTSVRPMPTWSLSSIALSVSMCFHWACHLMSWPCT